MRPHRIQARIALDQSTPVALEQVVPLFHHWIRDARVDGLLLDVADYRHVHQGPGVVLIGHEADRAVDFSDGRPGFRYLRKRDVAGTLAGALVQAVHGAAAGVLALVRDLRLPEESLTVSQVDVSLFDTLLYPNEASVFAGVARELTRLFRPALPVERLSSDPRAPLTIRVALPHGLALDSLVVGLSALVSEEVSHATL